MQECACYVIERDILLVETNENGEHCCKACKFNFKFRKDNLFAHVQGNFCPKGAVMPPKPVDRNSLGPKKQKATREMAIKSPTVINTTVTAKRRTVASTSMEAMPKVVIISNTLINTSDAVNLKSDILMEMHANDCPTFDSFQNDSAQATDKIILNNGSCDNFNLLNKNIDVQFAYNARTATATTPQDVLQSCPISYLPTYFPSYSQYAEFSPTSVPFQEMVRAINIPHKLPSTPPIGI